ncbi:hypothetical protein WA026_011012 [Henosepilachna vigintioctopunctata]|uniref:rRNA methyltransferase 2, mitochondrial n=1 Tax=Henosepilachna vigintioctopunctata TaxID=420089 RepID=A0AAW1UX96_9CUCU
MTLLTKKPLLIRLSTYLFNNEAKRTESRNFQTATCVLRHVNPTNVKNKSLSSQLWLKRQLSDPYVEKAKMHNYRCRSAFKLLEINEKYKFLKPGQIVVDCGAAPGSWTQVAVKEVNSIGQSSSDQLGKVFSIDKQHIYPIEGATILGNMDFTNPSTQTLLRTTLGDRQVQVVLSDMAPTATGIREMDTENMLTLCYNVIRFAVQVSEINGSLLVKLWQCGQAKKLETEISRFYRNVKFVKPNSSRHDSAEIFILGRYFKGLEK